MSDPRRSRLLLHMNPTNPDRKAPVSQSSHTLIIVVVRRPGKRAEVEVTYESNMAYLVGGEFTVMPYAAGSALRYVCNRERGLVGPVVVATATEHGFTSTPVRQLEEVMARLNAGDL